MSSLDKKLFGFLLPSHVEKEKIPGLIVKCKPGWAELLYFRFNKPITELTPSQELTMRLETSLNARECQWGDIGNLRGAKGPLYDVLLQAIPFTAEEFKIFLDKDHPLHAYYYTLIKTSIINAIALLVERGVRYIGCGGFTSVVISRDKRFRNQLHELFKNIVLVDGNSATAGFTAEAVLTYMDMSGLDLSKSLLAISGSYGFVGDQTSELLYNMGAQLLLHGPDETKLKAQADKYPGARWTTDIEQVDVESDFLISATSDPHSRLLSPNAKKNLRILDMGVPPNIDPASLQDRTDILIVRGGYIIPPGEHLTFEDANFEHPGHRVHPCMSQVWDSAVEEVTEDQFKRQYGEKLTATYQRIVAGGWKLAPPLDPFDNEILPERFLRTA